MVSNEVFVGANAQVGLCPEMDLYFQDAVLSNSTTLTLSTGQQDLVHLVPSLYVGCTIKIGALASNSATSYRTITANTATTISIDSAPVDSNGDAVSSGTVDATILSFGAPVYASRDGGTNPRIGSDNWIGLVNTFTPPAVEVEMKQLNLAAAGGRNFDFQYKGAESVSGGSLDLSLNNGSWLYYALGKLTFALPGTHATLASGTGENAIAVNASANRILRAYEHNNYPEIDAGGSDLGIGNLSVYNGTDMFTYTITEADDDVLPSFALDVVYRKAGQGDGAVLDGLSPNENMHSVIYTGCQVNTMTLNFEEGQELKTSLDLVTRRAFDPAANYLPLGGNASLAALSDTENGRGMVNYSATAEDNYPFLFSDGTIKLFGQTLARVKGGSLTINNNLTPQRFIGQYSRDITSAHLPGQRTYELALTMLITDTKLWDEMRNKNESTGALQLTFEKSGGEKIDIQLADYLINSVTIPFPEDKGPLEVEVAASARTLTSATYVGKWAIQTLGGSATGN
tara:strand:- start:2033 stop:3574 length:1542 start_codon:yes stop_codon:yes gene_type:complete